MHCCQGESLQLSGLNYTPPVSAFSSSRDEGFTRNDKWTIDPSSSMHVSYCVLHWPTASSYAIGLGGSKRSISDPLSAFLSTGYVCIRQWDRVCSFHLVLSALSGAFFSVEVGQVKVS